MFFVCFIFFLSSVGSVCLAGLLSASKTKTHARTLFKTRASMRRCWHRDSLRSDIWCSFFFFVSFLTFQFLYFCLLFFGETFGHRASAFLSFLIINMGGPEKKSTILFLSTTFSAKSQQRRIGLCNEWRFDEFFFLSYNLLRMLT